MKKKKKKERKKKPRVFLHEYLCSRTNQSNVSIYVIWNLIASDNNEVFKRNR